MEVNINNKIVLKYVYILCLFLLGLTLLLKPVILSGMINSGDPNRIIEVMGIKYSNCNIFQPTCFEYSLSHFPEIKLLYFSSTSYLLLFSILINYIVNPIANGYNIISFTIILSSIYLLALLYWVKQIKSTSSTYSAILFGLIVLVMLGDIIYLQYFYTFYQEATFIVFITAFSVYYLYGRYYSLTVLLLMMAVLSKQQNIVFILMLIPIYFKFKKNQKKYFFIRTIVYLFVCLSAIGFTYHRNSQYNGCMNHVSGFFDGVLHGVSNSDSVNIIKSMKLPADYINYSGLTFWGNTIPRADVKKIVDEKNLQDICDRVSMSTIVNGYMQNPSKIFSNYFAYIDNIDKFGPLDNNYYTPERFKLLSLSYFDKIILKNTGLITALLAILAIFMIIYRQKIKLSSSRLHCELFLYYLFLMPIMIVVSFIGDGFADTIKHSLSFYFIIALELLILMNMIINHFISRK